MKKPRLAILIFPGTNSEEETLDACRDAGMDARTILWSEPPADLRAYDAFVLPGGFAYEDRVRAGVVVAGVAGAGAWQAANSAIPAAEAKTRRAVRRLTSSSAPSWSYRAATSTGSPASRRFTKFVPLTTRP